ncbi:MAG: pilus assembly protein N-terminal domain-containing protein [Burkholderiaceae bacterium]|nr:pilus assembly protein N-terminal domain-containing protein [Burkholderiaceae bacterium]
MKSIASCQLARSARLIMALAIATVFAASALAQGVPEIPEAGFLPELSAETVAAVTGQAKRTMNLYVGQARVLDEGAVRRIAVGNGRVIQATALDERQVLVIAEQPGQSTLHVWTKSGEERTYVINVGAADGERLLVEVRAMLGEHSGVSARLVGDRVVVDGGNISEEQSARLAEITKRVPQIVNLVSKLGVERMIEMDVRMVEVKRSAMDHIGVKWSTSAAGPAFGLIGDLQRGATFLPDGAGGASGYELRPRVPAFSTGLGIASSVSSMLQFMVQNGDAVILAEPRLSCRSGGSARFVAGGELPIPYTGGNGAVSVMFKEYGVKFEISPQASASGVIAAKIAAEISAVNFEVMVREVPGLLKRRAETEVNLRENETLVIAGLVSDESARSIDKVPGLGDLPILGALFRSRQFREQVSDLYVFITPRFVDAGSAASRAELGAVEERVAAGRERVRAEN